jgi:hypothetical protein
LSIPFQLEDIRQILEGILNGEGSIGTTVNQGNAGVQSWLTSDSVTQSRLSTVATLLSGTLNIEGTGTAGSPNANVLTIQGISGGTPLPISGSITATNPSVSATGAAFPTSATLLGIISGSNLVGVSAGNPLPITGSISATNPSVSTIGSTSPTSATLIGGNDASGNLRAPGTTAASTAAIASQLALITAFSPNSPLPTGSNVIGSVSQNGAWSVSITGTPTVTANAGTGTFATSSAQLPAALDGSGYLKVHEQGTANVSVQNSSLTVVQSTAANLLATVSQGGSWTVTSNIGTTNGLALDTSVNGLLLSQGSTTASQKGPLILSATTTGSPTYSSGTSNPLSSTTAGALRVDASATTQPVSGSVSITGTPSVTISSGTVTVTQATGTNLHTVIDSGTVAATQSGAWSVSGTGTAGTPATGVMTVQGNASGTPVPVSGTVTASNPSVSTTGSAPPGSATYVGGSVTTASPSYTTGQISALSLTLAGALRVDGSGVTQPISGSVSITGTPAVTVSSGTVTVTQGTGSNLHTVVDSGSLIVTQATAANLNATVTGTVTANQGGAPWTFTGTGTTSSPAAGIVTIQGNASGVPIPISGSITATNPSVSTTGTAPPGSATYLGGSVTTASPTYTTGQMSGLSLTTAGALRIDGSGVTQPVSGTITANAGSGTFTVSGTVTANQGGTWTNTVTQATGTNLHTVVDSGNITVSGTVTANIGTSGSLALDTSVNGLLVAQGSTTASQKGTLTLGAVTTGSPSYTTAQTSPLSLTTAGALRIDGSATTQPISGSVSITGTPAVTISSGTVTVTQATGSNLHTVVDSGTLIVTQATAANLNATVTGTVTSNQGGAPWTVTGTGTAGSPAAGIVTIQGNASGTPIPISGSITATNPSVSTTGSAPPGSATYIGGSVTTSSPTYTTGQMSGLSLTTAGALRVDASATTQPISGSVSITGTPSVTVSSGTVTVTQATGTNLHTVIDSGTVAISGTVAVTESGTWTVQPGNTANTTPWLATINQGGNSATVTASNALKVDGSATTQPISGTITANAGTGTFAVSGTVTANIGTSGSLALDTSVSKLTLAQGSTTSGESGPLIQGAVTTASPTYTTSQTSPLSLTTAGALRVDASSTTQPISGTVTANAGSGTFTVSGTVASTQSGTWTVQPGNTANTTPWLSTISQGGNSATVTASNALKVDGSAVTQPVSGSVSITGTPAVTVTSGAITVSQATGTNLHTVIDSGTVTLSGTSVISGTVTANAGTGTFTVAGGLTNNNAAPSTNNIGALTAVATTSAPTYTNGDMVALSTDLSGNLRTNASNPSVSTTGSAPPASATYLGGSVTTASPTYTTGQMSGLSLTTAGALRVDASATTQPVSIASTVAVTQSGTWSDTVTQSVGSNLHTVVDSGTITLGAGSASVGTVILGAGSAAIGSLTANQSVNLTQINGTTALTGGTAGSLAIGGLGTAGTPSGGVLTVQGSSTGTSLPVVDTDITASGTITTQNLNSSGTATAGSAVAISLNGCEVVGMQISGTYTATGGLGVQATVDGVNWVSLLGSPIYFATNAWSGSVGSGFTGVFQICALGGFNQIRICCLGAVTGTATVTLRGSNGNGPVVLGQGAATSGSGIGAVQVNSISAGTSAIGSVSVNDGTKTTYSATIVGLASAATATDIFTITGTATKTVRVTHIEISGTQTTASEVVFQLIKRSTANTGGTSTAPAGTPHDSNNAAATATIAAYTANPTALGTAVGSPVRATRIFIPVSGTTAIATPYVWDFGSYAGSQAIVLRGITQVLAVSLNSTTVSGGSFNITVQWTEE